MTVTEIGTGTPSTSKTFTLTPSAVTDGSGDHFILVGVVSLTSADSATAIASSNVTWDSSPFSGPTTIGTYTSTVFKGKVSSTTPEVVTVTTAGSPTVRSVAKEFATSVGYSSITLDKAATVNKGAAFPSVTPTNTGESYFSYCYAETGTSAGSTSGFGYYIDPNSNPATWDTSCGTGAQAPNIGTADQLTGIAVMFFEASTSHTATASLVVTPSMSASRTRLQPRTASLTVTPTMSAHAGGGTTPTNAILDEAGDPILDEAGGFILDESAGTTSHVTAVALVVTPAMSAATVHSAHASASLTVAPVMSAHTAASHVTSASLTVAPVMSAAGTEEVPSFTPSVSLVVVPSFSAAALGHHAPSASLVVTPVLSAARTRAQFRSASLLVTPVMSVARVGTHPRTASLVVTPVLSVARGHLQHRSLSLVVAPGLLAAARYKAADPPGYPAGQLGARVELLLGGTWTDITAAALPNGSQNGSISSGQPDGAQQPSPTILNLKLANPDGDFSPRNSAGPYFGQLRQNTAGRVSLNSPYGAYLRLEGAVGSYASAPEASRLDITGSLEVRIELRMSDWNAADLCGKYDGSSHSSWIWNTNNDGTLAFFWNESGGTLRSVTSTAPVPVSARALRATLTASTGTVAFYTSTGIDGTWTQLGTSSSGTSGAATTIRSGSGGTVPLTVGWSANNPTWQLCGQLTGFRLYSGIGGTVVADAAFSTRPEGVTTWTDTPGNTWTLTGDAELSARDYRLTGELSSIAPTATVSGLATVPATLNGRLTRLQRADAPAADSAMRRAILSQTGSLVPVIYWTMEDGAMSASFGPAIGSNLMTFVSGVSAAADSSFEASAPLPQLGSVGGPAGTVPTYTGGTAWTVRFLLKVGATLPGSGDFSNICRVFVSGGVATQIDLDVDSTGTNLRLIGTNGGSGVFDSGWIGPWPTTTGAMCSIEAVPATGGKTQYNVVTVVPGASSGSQIGPVVLPPVTGVFGNVTGVQFNSLTPTLDDTVIGHVSVQKTWSSIFTLGAPLNAWRTELAAARFSRICAENGITCRILGSPALTQAMGPQPLGSVWVILRDCVQTDQGLLYEPRDVLGVGFRTQASMIGQPAAVTLDFAAATLPGNLIAADDALNLVNDVTASMPDGTLFRAVLDDGSSRSVSEPPAGAGRYAAAVPFPMNVAAASQLAASTAFYLAMHTVDEARYRQVTADFGIPGAPAADIARLREGDLIVITNVPAVFQTGDIRQLVTGATEVFGPGRKITWDCTAASPWDG